MYKVYNGVRMKHSNKFVTFNIPILCRGSLIQCHYSMADALAYATAPFEAGFVMSSIIDVFSIDFLD